MIAFPGRLFQETLAFTTINGASSTDATTFAGTSGVDVIALVNQSNLYLYGAQDDDILTATTFNNSYSGYSLNGGAGNDVYTLGTAGTNAQIVNASINGNQGNDTLTANGILTSATLNGGQGSDTITLNGATGAYSNGNKGNDSITLNNTAGGNGNYSSSTIRGGQGGDGIVIGSTTGTFNFDSAVYGDKGSDAFTAGFAIATAAGATFTNTGSLNGGDDGDTFNMSTSTAVGFTMNGDDGADTMRGANSATSGDTITGGAGNDVFQTVAGTTITGQTATTVDVITDFASNADVFTDTSGAGYAFANAANTSTAGSSISATGVITFAAGSNNTFANAVNQVFQAIDDQAGTGAGAGGGDAARTLAVFAFGGQNYLFVSDGDGGLDAGDNLFAINTSINTGITRGTFNGTANAAITAIS